MALQMAQPFKHSRTGVYYFRQKVPADLRAALGDKIVQRSLRTKDPAEAKIRHLEEAQKQATVWAAHRNGPQSIPFQSIVALCGDLYREWIEMRTAEPGEPAFWRETTRLFSELTDLKGTRRAEVLEKWYGSEADKLLSRAGLIADANSRVRLLELMNDTVLRVSETLHRRAEGDYGPDPTKAVTPPL